MNKQHLAKAADRMWKLAHTIDINSRTMNPVELANLRCTMDDYRLALQALYTQDLKEQTK